MSRIIPGISNCNGVSVTASRVCLILTIPSRITVIRLMTVTACIVPISMCMAVDGTTGNAMTMGSQFPGGYILKGMIKMTIPAIKSFTNYNKYKTESGYTKQGELQQYMQNQNDCLAALTQAMLWQPETEYKIGKVITSPSMPTGVRAKVTTAGKTSDTEPTWTAAGTTVEDGTVAYTIESLDYTQLLTEAVKTLTTAIADAKKEALLEAHPVGSYYFSDDATNPGKLFGGTWEAIDPGYGLIAQGTATAEDGTKLTFTAGNKYGEFKHQLTVGELPKIEGEIWNIAWQSADNQISKSGVFSDSTHRENVGYATSVKTNSSDGFGLKFGADKYHNNMPPTISAYAWKRTA